MIMRIAFIVGEFPCLSETFVLNQITGLIARGHEVEIHADPPAADTHTTTGSVRAPVFYRPRMPRNLALRAWKALWLVLYHGFRHPVPVLRALNVAAHGRSAASLRLLYGAIPLLDWPARYDIVHCQFGPNGVLGEFLRDAGLIAGKLIVTLHGSDMSAHVQKLGEHAYDRLFARADLLLPVSERWRQRLRELGCPEGKLLVHRMGIDCRQFLGSGSRQESRGPVQLVTVGRLVEKKGIEYAIRSVAQLVRDNKPITYNVIGDGPLRDSLQGLIRELAVTDQVQLLGRKSPREIIEILRASDILLAPSVTAQDGDEEGVPVAIMEAMAMGLPVVATRHGGIPELVAHGTSGYLVPERDTDALVNQLTRLLTQPNEWDRCGRAGRAIIERDHDIEKLEDELVKIYERVRAGTPTARTADEARPA